MKYFFRKRKILTFSVLILIVFFASFSVIFAAGLPWFGGRITTVVPCTCSTGFQVGIIGYPATFSGTYLYLPGATQVRGKGNVLPSRLILGLYSSGGVCMIGIPPECSNLQISKGTMKIIGTN